MATLNANKIQEALKKAQRVGQVEETLTIGEFDFVLSSLTIDQFEDIDRETTEAEEGVAYYNAFKREHLARSIVEINGEDLRDINFVEVEIEEPNPQGGPPVLKKVNLERHIFIRDFVIRSWAREAIDIAFQKFNDLVEKGERFAAKDIKFETPPETDPVKYRRLLQEARELGAGISVEITSAIRQELGFGPPEETHKGFKKEVEPTEADTPVAPLQATPTPQAAPPTPAPAPQPDPTPSVPLVRPPQAGAPTRVPLNQRMASVPIPQAAPAQPVAPVPQAAPMPQVAYQRPVPSSPQVQPEIVRKSAEIEALEDLGLPDEEGTDERPLPPHGIPVLQPVGKDTKSVVESLDQRPPGGINPRYRHHNR